MNLKVIVLLKSRKHPVW